jgi:putative flippase GtrA
MIWRRLASARLSRFALVGLASTILYAAITWTVTRELGVPAAVASLFAYALSAMFSYMAHRTFTFRATGRHVESAPVFAGISIVGYLVSTAVPLVLTDMLGAPLGLTILITCLPVPILSYFAMGRFAFRTAAQ